MKDEILVKIDSFLTLLAFRHSDYMNKIGERDEALRLSGEIRTEIARDGKPQSKEKTAWLIERDDLGYPEWLHIDSFGMWAWSTDPNKSLKFADEASALLVKKYTPRAGSAKAVEHSWPEGF